MNRVPLRSGPSSDLYSHISAPRSYTSRLECGCVALGRRMHCETSWWAEWGGDIRCKKWRKHCGVAEDLSDEWNCGRCDDEEDVMDIAQLKPISANQNACAKFVRQVSLSQTYDSPRAQLLCADKAEQTNQQIMICSACLVWNSTGSTRNSKPPCNRQIVINSTFAFLVAHGFSHLVPHQCLPPRKHVVKCSLNSFSSLLQTFSGVCLALFYKKDFRGYCFGIACSDYSVPHTYLMLSYLESNQKLRVSLGNGFSKCIHWQVLFKIFAIQSHSMSTGPSTPVQHYSSVINVVLAVAH